eukprot:SAG22_NODE_336_length_12071_cov_10.875125_13_plen_84_part_00
MVSTVFMPAAETNTRFRNGKCTRHYSRHYADGWCEPLPVPKQPRTQLGPLVELLPQQQRLEFDSRNLAQGVAADSITLVSIAN